MKNKNIKKIILSSITLTVGILSIVSIPIILINTYTPNSNSLNKIDEKPINKDSVIEKEKLENYMKKISSYNNEQKNLLWNEFIEKNNENILNDLKNDLLDMKKQIFISPMWNNSVAFKSNDYQDRIITNTLKYLFANSNNNSGYINTKENTLPFKINNIDQILNVKYHNTLYLDDFQKVGNGSALHWFNYATCIRTFNFNYEVNKNKKLLDLNDLKIIPKFNSFFKYRIKINYRTDAGTSGFSNKWFRDNKIMNFIDSKHIFKFFIKKALEEK